MDEELKKLRISCSKTGMDITVFYVFAKTAVREREEYHLKYLYKLILFIV